MDKIANHPAYCIFEATVSVHFSLSVSVSSSNQDPDLDSEFQDETNRSPLTTTAIP